MFRFHSRFRLATLLLATPLIFSACKDDKDDPIPDEENEQITTVSYVLTPTTGGGSATTVTWRDTDGTGGNDPTIGTLTLKPNTTYTGTIAVLDETKTPPANITEEILEEKDDHLFFYAPTLANLLEITSTDRDSKNLPVGITTQVVTNSAGTGSLKITLRHQPGAKDGTFAPGDTDVEVTFPVKVQ
ncbi:hypothetical protein [Hymenobacter terrenus]|uniref:hypothetical protein n=1 Tax=Hymenobacter terrenus TaxID=1629124 RepID=UPI00061A017B|nr:hypothetical protein [Hymenobacter terrenus]